ncbi:hypothetical protein [Gordonia paraffinivorans]|uniref:hypothetical protein n=1 Tax=Gordonia paraffinivorans TaxID=175628 RepID=UPI00242FE492|nr:hypothetical protein [Gordonia paraffinivorans]
MGVTATVPPRTSTMTLVLSSASAADTVGNAVTAGAACAVATGTATSTAPIMVSAMIPALRCFMFSSLSLEDHSPAARAR